MDKKIVLILAIGGIVASLLCVIVALQASAIVWMIVELRQEPDLGDVLEEFVDEQIDAGLGDVPTDMSDPLLKQRKILLTHTVNAQTAKHVTRKLMYLNGADDSQPIDLFISTQGGYSDSAFTIIDTMRIIEAPVNTWAIGGCYSAGAMILAAGTGSRYGSENAIIMIHTNLDNSTEPYTYNRLGRARYERLWRDTADLPVGWFPMTDDGTYYLTAKEAMEFAVIDEVVGGVEID